MHAWRNPEHERALAERLRAWDFAEVSCSSEVAPRIKLLQRAETAVVDAYLAPVVRATSSACVRVPGASGCS